MQLNSVFSAAGCWCRSQRHKLFLLPFPRTQQTPSIHVVVIFDHPSSECTYNNSSSNNNTVNSTTGMGFTAWPLTAATVVVMTAASSSSVQAFVAPSSQMQLLLGQHPAPARSRNGRVSVRHGRGATLNMKYVPDGLSPEQWKKMQKEEAAKKKKMGDLGQVSSTAPVFVAIYFRPITRSNILRIRYSSTG